MPVATCRHGVQRFLFCSVHTRIEEKITCVASRGGGVESLEVLGILHLLVSDSANEKIAVKVTYDNSKGAQMNVSRSLPVEKHWYIAQY